MDFELSDDQQHLRDSVRSVLDSECTPSVVRAAYDGTEVGHPSRLWKVVSKLGWPAIEVPESLGGLGMGFVELALISEELGRVVAPAPFMSTVTQFVPMVLETASAEQQKALLSPVLEDGSTGAVAIAEPHSAWDYGRSATRAVRTSEGWLLTGQKSFVFDGATASTILVVAKAERGEGIGVFALPSSAVTTSEAKQLDPTQPLSNVELDGVQVSDDAVLVEPGDPTGAAGIERAVERATAALALSMNGTCRAIFDTTLQYAKDREQFGRPIGSFQAIKHRLVNMLISLERATSLAYFAALTIAEDDPRRSIAVSMAKAAAGDCQRTIVQDGLQLHGGIGYMWEQNLHFCLKRAKSSDLLFGSSSAHKAKVARSLGLVAW